MNDQAFIALLAQLPTLTDGQFKELITEIGQMMECLETDDSRETASYLRMAARTFITRK